LPSAITEFPISTAGNYLGSLTVGPDGNLWFPELAPQPAEGIRFYPHKVVAIDRLTPSGALLAFPLPPNNGIGQFDLTVGPDGNLWFPEPGLYAGPGGIGRITPAGTITEFPLPGGAETSLSSAVTAGPDGNLWFSVPQSGINVHGAIGRITPAGAVTEFPLRARFSVSGTLTVGPDGNLWFHEGGYIGRITPSGVITEFATPSANLVTGDLTVGPDRNLWFAEHSDHPARTAIARITPSRTLTEFPLPAPNYQSGDLTVGPGRDLWFAETPVTGRGYSKIGRITPAGAVTEFQLPTAGMSPGDLTVGPDGNLWFSETPHNPRGDSKIGRITPAGAVTEFPFPTADMSPRGLTVGPDGDLWFPVDSNNYSMGTDTLIGRIDPTPPRVMGALAVTSSEKAITSILLRFDAALDPGAAGRVGFYSLSSGVKRGHLFVSSKGVKIASVSYDPTARTVTLDLARPQKRTIRVKVRAGLVAADGMSSSSDFTAVVT
jgi:virginiamycin B lyase